MKNTNKTYTVDGVKYQFDSVCFNAFLNYKKFIEAENENKLTKAKISEDLADRLHVSTDAIKNWLYGYNGPSDVEQIKAIGEYFDIDYSVLLRKVEGQNMIDEIKLPFSPEGVALEGIEKRIGDYIETKRCVRNIYHKMLDYVLETKACFEKYQRLEDGEVSEALLEEEGMDNNRLKDLYFELQDEVTRCYLDLSADLYHEIRSYMWGVMFEFHDDVALGKLCGPNYKPTKEEKKKEADRVEEMKNYFSTGFYEDVENLFGYYIVSDD